MCIKMQFSRQMSHVSEVNSYVSACPVTLFRGNDYTRPWFELKSISSRVYAHTYGRLSVEKRDSSNKMVKCKLHEPIADSSNSLGRQRFYE